MFVESGNWVVVGVIRDAPVDADNDDPDADMGDKVVIAATVSREAAQRLRRDLLAAGLDRYIRVDVEESLYRCDGSATIPMRRGPKRRLPLKAARRVSRAAGDATGADK